MNTMNKVSCHVHKRISLEALQEPLLLQALKGAKMPATQSALSQITARKAKIPPLTANCIGASDSVTICTPPSAKIQASAESLLRALAQSLQAWRGQLPPDLQPGLLALVHGGASIDVQSLVFCAPDFIRVSGSYEGGTYKLLAPASEIQFFCVPKTGALDAAAAFISFELGDEVFSA
ncbi:MAG: hypothetical protein JHD06_04735 [Rhodoferax sp.]|jgi:hypothetical protein|nr:hypothetical protein [Rhodoferax sp.]